MQPLHSQVHSPARTCADLVPLRVGVALGSGQVPRWSAKVLDDIEGSEHLELALIVRIDAPRDGLWARFARAVRTALFRAWSRWDRRYFSKPADDSLRSVDLPPNMDEDIPNINLHFEQGHIVHTRERAALKNASLDILLQLSAVPLACEVAKAAQCAVWYFGEAGEAETGTSLFALITEGATVFPTTLLAVDESGANRLLCRTISRINPASLYRNQNSAGWLKSEILIRELLASGRSVHAALNPAADCPQACSARTTAATGNLNTARYLGRWTAGLLSDRIQDRFKFDQWVIAFRKKNGRVYPPADMSGFHIITPPPDRSYADPFVATRAGKTYVLFENFWFAVRKGIISCVEVDDVGNHTDPVPVLEKDHHLSYPFMFEWQGETFLVPEMKAANCIEVYRAVDFPYRWSLEKTLINDVSVVDSTLLEYEGKWWLFASGVSARGGAFNQDLHLFYSDSPFGRWLPHPKNPIVCDVRRARPAGQLFASDGRLIRPSQDCAKTYGYATIFNQVEVLSETDYCELPVGSITPDWLPGQLGIHTFNQNEFFQVVDARVLMRGRRERRSGSAAQSKPAKMPPFSAPRQQKIP